MENVDVLPDLRAHNSGLPTKFDFVWKKCGKFLAENIGVAVDERRHGTITHLARAISVRDFVQQVRRAAQLKCLYEIKHWGGMIYNSGSVCDIRKEEKNNTVSVLSLFILFQSQLYM